MREWLWEEGQRNASSTRVGNATGTWIEDPGWRPGLENPCRIARKPRLVSHICDITFPSPCACLYGRRRRIQFVLLALFLLLAMPSMKVPLPVMRRVFRFMVRCDVSPGALSTRA